MVAVSLRLEVFFKLRFSCFIFKACREKSHEGAKIVKRPLIKFHYMCRVRIRNSVTSEPKIKNRISVCVKLIEAYCHVQTCAICIKQIELMLNAGGTLTI